MSTPYRLGEKAVLYYQATPVTAANTTTPSTTVAIAKDVKSGAKRDTPEYTTRENNGFKQYASSLGDLTVSCDVKVPGAGTTGADNTAYNAIRDAWINGTEIALWALNDTAANGGEGPAGNFVVSDLSEDQSNGKVLFKTVEFKPSSFNSYYIASSGSA